MRPDTTLFLIQCGVLLLVCGLQLPLLWRRIPRNRMYGLRVPETLADDEVWYEANANGARWFLFAAPVILAVMSAVFVLTPHDGSRIHVHTGIFVAGVIIPAIGSVIQARQISQRIMARRRSRGGS